MKKTLLSIAVFSFLLFGNSPQELPAKQTCHGETLPNFNSHGGTFPQKQSVEQAGHGGIFPKNYELNKSIAQKS